MSCVGKDWPAVLQANTDYVSCLGCPWAFLSPLLEHCTGARLLHILQAKDWGSQWEGFDQASTGSVQRENLYLPMVGVATSTSNLKTMTGEKELCLSQNKTKKKPTVKAIMPWIRNVPITVCLESTDLNSQGFIHKFLQQGDKLTPAAELTPW